MNPTTKQTEAPAREDLHRYTVPQLAGFIAAMIVQYEREDGETFLRLQDGRPEWMLAVIRAAHDGWLPDDYRYRWAYHALDRIKEAADREEARDMVYDVEADAYTHDLTTWLASDNRRVYYLTEALEEFGNPEDGFRLLATAQYLERREVGHATLHALEHLADGGGLE